VVVVVVVSIAVDCVQYVLSMMHHGQSGGVKIRK